MAAVTLDEFTAFINTTLAPTDPRTAELERTLAAALTTVEARVGPLEAQVVTYRAREEGGLLLLPAVRVGSLVALEDPSGGLLLPADLDRVRQGADLASGVLWLPYRASLPSWASTAPPRWWMATVQVGFSPVPEDLKLATLIVAGHLWETQRGGSARPAIMGGEPGGGTARGFAIPYRAQTLMDPYLLPSDLART